MLEDCLIESRPSGKTRKPFTLVVSVLTHGSLIAALVIVPLFQEQLLPHTSALEPLRPPEVRSNVTRVAGAPAAAPKGAVAPPVTSDSLFAPVEIPRNVAIIVDAPIGDFQGMPTGPGGPGGSPFGIPGGFPLAIGDRAFTPPSPPPTPPPAPPKAAEPPPAPTEPVRRVSTLMASQLIHQVQPVYPYLAKTARVEGAVVIEAVITRQGTIDPARVRVLSGHTLLNQAATDAVVQWRYRPTILNSEAVEVITTITINFTLSR